LGKQKRLAGKCNPAGLFLFLELIFRKKWMTKSGFANKSVGSREPKPGGNCLKKWMLRAIGHQN
jgi:hypothetical protein